MSARMGIARRASTPPASLAAAASSAASFLQTFGSSPSASTKQSKILAFSSSEGKPSKSWSYTDTNPREESLE